MQFRLLPPTLALLLCGPAIALAVGGGFKEFQSWQVTCSQARDCSMRQFIPDSAISQVELKRAGGPETPVTIAVSTDDEALATDAGGASASISIDGGAPLSIPAGGVRYDPVGAMLLLSGDFIGNGLVAALKNGTTMHLKLRHGAASVEADIALAGFAAGLLFMDDLQRRVGHTDALSAPGDKPPSPPIPFRNIAAFSALPEAIRRRFAEGGECADTEESLLDGNAFAHQISENETLYATPCGTPGAYNFPYAMFVESYGSVTRMAFPVMQEGAPSTVSDAYNLDYDFEARSLTAFFRGRGIGDCGTYNEWHLASNQGGPVLLLDRETSKDCDGDDLGGPQNWPAQWPLK
ncbi:DUF1176 domain-containing protein [Rhizobium sp. SL42]|uniref:DUF1176 domain-containing protein n=1 Tax=Rhizobium sp. SL42 TaxID=2806346 RepID=UPI001F2C4D68|nr:DUF1176 domain-containing protein [Rhizobium sp. SL42]UJW75910.1 DUF1176 domain-containing protein [Rhizobium sp. SL42]